MSQQRRVVDNGIRPRRPGAGSGPAARRRAVLASEPPWDEFRKDPAVDAAEALSAFSGAVDAAIHVEARISRFLPFWADQSGGFDLAGVEDLAEGLVAELEDMGDTPALITLRALAAVADPWLAEPSHAAAERVGRRVHFMPDWAAQIGRAEPTRALALPKAEDDHDDEDGLLIDFEYPDGERHAIAVYIDPRLGRVAKHVFLLGHVDDNAGADFEPMAIDEAKRRMRAALEITPPDGVPGGEGQFELGALAWARVRD